MAGPCCGGCAHGATPPWGKLAREERDRLNPLALQQYFRPSDHAQVHALLAPAQPQDIERIDADLVNSVLSFSRQHFPFSVVDLPAAFDDATLAALVASDLIILVLTPDVAGVGLAVKAMQVFDVLGYTEQRVRLISNQPYDEPGIATKHIEKTLGRKLDITLPHEKSSYLAAINLGQPFLTRYPKRPVAREFRRLAAQVRKMRAAADGSYSTQKHKNGRSPVLSNIWGRAKSYAR